MNTKVDQLFQKIYNDTTQYIDSNFIDGDRNVGRLNSAKKITLSKDPILQNEIEIKKLSNLKIMPEPKILENYVLNVNSCVLNESLNNCVAIVKNISTNTHEDCLYLADEYKNEFMDLIEKGVDIKISCIKTNKDLAFDSSLALQENLL